MHKLQEFLAIESYPTTNEMIIEWGDRSGQGQGRVTIHNVPVEDKHDFSFEGRSLPTRMIKKMVLQVLRNDELGEIGSIEWWVVPKDENVL